MVVCILGSSLGYICLSDIVVFFLVSCSLVQSKNEVESEKHQKRYNLRRRKDDGDGRSAEAKPVQELHPSQENSAKLSAIPAASAAPQLDFGGKIGRFCEAPQRFYPAKLELEVGRAAGGRAADPSMCIKEECCHVFSVPGAYFWLLFLPAWVLFLIFQVNLADPSLANFPPAVPALETWWDVQALGFVVLWIVFQALLYALPVGKVSVNG